MAAFLVGTVMAVSVGRYVSVPHLRAPVAEAPLTPAGLWDPSHGDVVPIDDLRSAVGVQPGLTQDRDPRTVRPGDGAHTRPSPGRTGEAPVGPPDGSGISLEPSDPDRYRTANGPGSPPALVVGPRQAVGAASKPRDPLAVPRTHLVRSRETLWSIAEDELGTALRWQELAEMNYGVAQEDGRALDQDHWIRPGWRLLLPPPTPGGKTGAPVSPVAWRGPSGSGSHGSTPDTDPRRPGAGRLAGRPEIHRDGPPVSTEGGADEEGAVRIGTGSGQDRGSIPIRPRAGRTGRSRGRRRGRRRRRPAPRSDAAGSAAPSGRGRLHQAARRWRQPVRTATPGR